MGILLLNVKALLSYRNSTRVSKKRQTTYCTKDTKTTLNQLEHTDLHMGNRLGMVTAEIHTKRERLEIFHNEADLNVSLY